jgi:signal transduction histidine kinase
MVAVVAVTLTTILLIVLTDTYMEKERQQQLQQAETQLVNALKNDKGDPLELKRQEYARILSGFVRMPIKSIAYYDNAGILIARVDAPPGQIGPHQPPVNEQRIQIKDAKGKLSGMIELGVLAYHKVPLLKRLAQSSLFMSYFIAMAIVLALALSLSWLFSRRITDPLEDTAKLAGDLLVDIKELPPPSNIEEVSTIRDTLTDLDSRLRLKRQGRKLLLDELVHQTRTPLTVLKTHLEALEDGLIPYDEREKGILYKEIDSLTVMISNMSSMIDASSETENLQLKEFNLPARLQTIAAGLRPQFEKKGLQLDLDLVEKLHITSDPNVLSQIVYNLLTNSQKYTSSGGKVELGCKKEADAAVIWVRDNGIGISKEDQTHIFEAYFRSARVAGLPGEGIGLYLVGDQIKRLHGKLDVVSELDEGSCFTLKLPLTLAEDGIFPKNVAVHPQGNKD